MRRHLLACSLLLPTLAAAAGPTPYIEVWTRKPGPHAGHVRGRAYLVSVDLSKLPQQERELTDVQLKSKRTYRGVSFKTLVAAAPPGADLDLALLHFANGMVVPLPLHDEAALAKVDLFVATAVKQGDAFTADFPPLRKDGAQDRDRRPIVFEGNKVVAATRWHPLTALEGDAVFSPWAHVDRLEGVEYAKSGAYWKQFDFGQSAELQRGLKVYQSRCGFCHGLDKVGASYGWDYLVPVPLSEHRKPGSLALHVRFREADAPEQGLMMPSVKEFSDADAKALHKWIAAGAKASPGPYAP